MRQICVLVLGLSLAGACVPKEYTDAIAKIHVLEENEKALRERLTAVESFDEKVTGIEGALSLVSAKVDRVQIKSSKQERRLQEIEREKEEKAEKEHRDRLQELLRASGSGEGSMKHSDPLFGDLIFVSDRGWWEGYVTLPSGSSFSLYVHTPTQADQSITDAARATFEKMRQSEPTARQFAASELLASTNDKWSRETTIDTDEFISQLVPRTIRVWPDGDAEISFWGADLFYGFEISVRYSGEGFIKAVLRPQG